MELVKVMNSPEAPDLSRYEALDEREISRLLAQVSRLRQDAERVFLECKTFERFGEPDGPASDYETLEGLTEAAAGALEDVAELEWRLAAIRVKNSGHVVTYRKEWPFA